jgi:threonyl-tRNA synthetase
VLTNDCSIKPIYTFEQDIFWHSSAHILGSAIEKTFPDAQLTHGPPTKDGFFYDFFSPSNEKVTTYDSLE